jgi:hypothetical protein
MKETKKSQAIRLFNSGDLKGSYRIAKGFRIELKEEERRIVAIAYECLSGKENFYKQIGENPEEIQKKALEIMQKYSS